MRVQFENKQYIMSHGKNPPAREVGNWAFDVTLTGNGACSKLGVIWAHGTLGQAKSEIRARVKSERSFDSKVTGAYAEVLP